MSIPATGLIWLAKAAPTARAHEAALMQCEHYLVTSQRHIALASLSSIVHLRTDPLTVRAIGSFIGPDDLDFNAAISLYLLTENP